ncbi:MAG: pyruvate dehydrogenase (acetyl-transferring), homodimeric type [Thermoanaerobaculia bacterium]|nr:pyruvate dehydrogenase (acetyl-transferring), homodimeric type [Thermoanaerobaculia bacterium]
MSQQIHSPVHPSDLDPVETREWLESLHAVLRHDGGERARFLVERLVQEARAAGVDPEVRTTDYVNTIPADQEPAYPGDLQIERDLRVLLRWNAMAMVVRGNKHHEGIGGHIATYQSASNLLEVGFQHFWHAPTESHGGDLVFFQGHASPGIYARSFLEGRFDETTLDRFRLESKPGGLSSYPHPWLMPDYWQFATVSMGLGPLMAIYQARFLKYMHHRGLADMTGRHVWAFCGDGEMDEPESQGALTVAAREGLDNLIFIVNCNLQRLDGPVRGNSKIVQELEGLFRGAGWRVLKVLWGSAWDPLLAADESGKLRKAMMDAPDGEWQNYGATSRGGAYFREKFFGRDPELMRLIDGLDDDDLMRLKRGGHDEKKIYAAYRTAVESSDGRPTVILAQTIKGYGMGEAGEGLNITHQKKKLDPDDVRAFRRRFGVPVSDEETDELDYARPDDDSRELVYLREQRARLGGPFPVRRTDAEPLPIPELSEFGRLLESSGEREYSTTTTFVNFLRQLTRKKGLKERLVPILADEARTFGMEGLFKPLGIYAPFGQKYEPIDSDQLMNYHEAEDGQILQEGINEGGALASWAAAGMSYSTHGLHMVPFYIFYSMFGFQRVGDLIWAAADMQARGFLLGATSGRTTLNGEGLQHEDGHSHLMAATVPTCRAYDPTYSYETAVILHDGLRRMYGEADENVFYYVTVLNENYRHPALPEGAEEGILRGMYRLRTAETTSTSKPRVQLLGSGAILREVEAAADLLHDDWGISADVWSVTSFTELRRDGLACDRRALLHPEADTPPTSWVAQQLAGAQGPVVASTDYMASFADQIRPWVPRRYVTLGTDGFGRSDTREALRDFFEVDRRWVTVAALKALADEGTLDPARVREALDRYGIDPEKPDPSRI